MLTPVAPERQLELALSLGAFHRYLARLLERRRRVPQPDLLSNLAQAVEAGKAELSDAEIINLVSQLIAAGTETTMFALGTCLSRLLRERAAWRRVAAAPETIPAVVEEALRCNRAQRGLLRVATRDADLGGVTIPAGARVYALHTAANRDPGLFDNPAVFDPARRGLKRHIAFGQGVHTCLGAALARLEMRVALTALSARLPDLALSATKPITLTGSPVVRSIDQLWAEWTPP